MDVFVHKLAVEFAPQRVIDKRALVLLRKRASGGGGRKKEGDRRSVMYKTTMQHAGANLVCVDLGTVFEHDVVVPAAK